MDRRTVYSEELVILQNSVDKLTKVSYDVENEVPVALSDRDILLASPISRIRSSVR